MTEFSQAVVSVVQGIPAGRVTTYGDVAAAAGSPRSSRQVVWVLRNQSTAHKLPWHRVISRKGKIAIKEPEGAFLQKRFLEEEGIPVGSDGTVSLEVHGYVPPYIRS